MNTCPKGHSLHDASDGRSWCNGCLTYFPGNRQTWQEPAVRKSEGPDMFDLAVELMDRISDAYRDRSPEAFAQVCREAQAEWNSEVDKHES